MARLNPDTPEVEFTISNRTILRLIVAAILAIIAFAAIRQAAHTLVWIGVAVFLALALNAPVRWLAEHLPGKRRGNRAWATALSIAIIVILLGVFLYFIVPPLVSQTTKFIKQVPHLISSLHDQNSSLGHFIREHHLEGQVNKLSSQLSGKLNNIGGTAFSALSTIGSSIFAAVTITVLTIMMLATGPRWRRVIERLIPRRHAKRTQKLAHDMHRVIQGYVNGQVLLAAIASALIVPMLFILGISNPLALMVIVFICGLIPMVGHTIGAIIITIVALFHSVPSAIIILAYYILYQQIENYVIQPRIQANATNMSALLVFIAVILGANFSGLLGALVAIPIMGCIRVAVLDYLDSRDLLSHKTVEDEKSQPKAA